MRVDYCQDKSKRDTSIPATFVAQLHRVGRLKQSDYPFKFNYTHLWQLEGVPFYVSTADLLNNSEGDRIEARSGFRKQAHTMGRRCPSYVEVV